MYQSIEENIQYPTMQEFRNQYRQYFGTGKEDGGDTNRLNKTYEKYFNQFKTEIENSIQSKLLFLQGKLKEIITEEEIQQIQHSQSSYDRKIYYEDIATAGLWIYSCLVNKTYRELKQFAGKQETVPMVSLSSYFRKLKDMGLIKNKCNSQKAKALRILLEHIGWIRIVDDSYDFHRHRAMTYILESKHPYYQIYENIVGKEVVQGWRELAEGQQNRKSAS